MVFGVFFGGCGGSDTKVMGTIETGLSRQFIWHIGKSNWTNGYWDIGVKMKKSKKNSQIIVLMPIVTTNGGAGLKVMDTIESGLLRRFFWHLAKSDWTYGSWDINCQENSRGGGAGAGAAGGVQ